MCVIIWTDVSRSLLDTNHFVLIWFCDLVFRSKDQQFTTQNNNNTNKSEPRIELKMCYILNAIITLSKCPSQNQLIGCLLFQMAFKIPFDLQHARFNRLMVMPFFFLIKLKTRI